MVGLNAAPKLAVREIRLFERDVTLRLPFRFGVVTLTAAPQCFARVRVGLADGREAWGLAAEMLAPKWFDKNLSLTNEENFEQLRQALAIVNELKPIFVLGAGGYVTGPGGLAAWMRRVPVIIHEQNAVVGTANRLLARIAARRCEGFPGSFADDSKRRSTGNPVREDIFQVPALDYDGSRRPRLLILGGSLGAAPLNRIVPEAVAMLPLEDRPEIVHQCGKQHVEAASDSYATAGVQAIVELHDCARRENVERRHQQLDDPAVDHAVGFAHEPGDDVGAGLAAGEAFLEATRARDEAREHRGTSFATVDGIGLLLVLDVQRFVHQDASHHARIGEAPERGGDEGRGAR